MHLNDNFHVYPKKVISIPSLNEKLPVTDFQCLDRLNLSQYDNAFQNFRVFLHTCPMRGFNFSRTTLKMLLYAFCKS